MNDFINVIKTKFSGKNRYEINAVVLSKFLKENLDIQVYLQSILDNEPMWLTIRNVFFGILFDERIRKCKTCGKSLKYTNSGDYCSKLCLNHDPEIIAKAKETRERTCMARFGAKCNLSTDENKAKVKATCLKKYGVEYAIKSEQSKEKYKKTMIERYGVDNLWKTKECQEKCRATQIKNGGIGFQRKELKENAKQLFIEKYGVDNPWKSKEVIENIKETKKKNCLEKYGVDNVMKVAEFNEKRMSTNLQRYGVKHPAQSFEYRKKYNERSFDEHIEAYKNYVIPLFSKDEFIGCKKNHLYEWKCLKCNNNFESDCFAGMPRCPQCYPIHCNSFDEIELLDFVKTYFPNAKRDRNLIYPLELDILIEDIKIAIEYNGSYWHSIEMKPTHYHLNKTKLCNEKDYRLIHIWEDEWKFDKDKIKENLHQIFIGNESLNFLGDVIRLDKSWYNNIDIPNYEFKQETAPILIERNGYSVENCGMLIFEIIK